MGEATNRWSRLEPDERRHQILAAAIRLFGERPYAAVSTAELAQAAGVTRGLLHHYFGTKRELYLEVVRTMMFVPPATQTDEPPGNLEQRVESVIGWLLDVIEAHGQTWVRVSGAEGIGADPDVQRILDQADDLAAERVLDVLGHTGTKRQRDTARAAIRAYGGMVKAVGREWFVNGTLTRAQAQALLSDTLRSIVEATLPRIGATR